MHFIRELAPGDFGEDVALVQRLLGVYESGFFDETLEARVRGFQLTYGLAGTGLVDEATISRLNAKRAQLTGSQVSSKSGWSA